MIYINVPEFGWYEADKASAKLEFPFFLVVSRYFYLEITEVKNIGDDFLAVAWAKHNCQYPSKNVVLGSLGGERKNAVLARGKPFYYHRSAAADTIPLESAIHLIGKGGAHE